MTLPDLFPVAQATNTASDVQDIPLSSLIPFHNHPFIVEDNADMDALVDSIDKQGLIEPILVRKASDTAYEVLSGHRRLHAYKRLNKVSIPCKILTVSDDEAALIMYSSNIYRTDISPSEKAHAAKIAYEALKNEGKLGMVQVEPNADESSEIKGSDEFKDNNRGLNLSKASLIRLIKLLDLNEGLMRMVDDKRIAENTGYNLAFLKKEEQDGLVKMILEGGYKVDIKKAEKLKELSKSKELTDRKIKSVLEGKDRDNKGKEGSKKGNPYITKLRKGKLKGIVNDDITDEELENVMIRLLIEYLKGMKEGE